MTDTMTPTEGSAGADEDLVLLLFYLLLDESASMAGERIDTINAVLPKLHQAMRAHPAVSDKVRVSIIAFSDTPTTVLELADLAEVESIQGLVPRSSTNYGAAFSHLRKTIESDVAALVADGYGVHRPAVFFMSDGAPSDEGGWQGEHAKLVDPNWPLHPNVVAFGIGDANESVISAVATLAAYMADSGVSAPDALGTWAKTLLQTMLRSAGTNTLAVPTQVAGYHQVGMSRVA